MRFVVFSFDDARSDFYTRAFPILKKYNIPSTLNVITNFLSDKEKKSRINFPSSNSGMTKENLLECYESGLIEVACHGANHLNTKEDIINNIESLLNLGIKGPFGFASPNSVITENNKNDNGIWDLIKEGKLQYVRSGIQIRREGGFYTALSLVDRFLHSDVIYYYLNQRNIITKFDSLNTHIVPSVAVFSYTRRHQIESLIEKQKDSTAIILMFHSVLRPGDECYGCDKYYWDAKEFESLCSFIKRQNDVRVCMTKDLFSI